MVGSGRQVDKGRSLALYISGEKLTIRELKKILKQNKEKFIEVTKCKISVCPSECKCTYGEVLNYLDSDKEENDHLHFVVRDCEFFIPEEKDKEKTKR